MLRNPCLSSPTLPSLGQPYLGLEAKNLLAQLILLTPTQQLMNLVGFDPLKHQLEVGVVLFSQLLEQPPFCSCMSSKAWPVTSISTLGLLLLQQVGRGKMEQWTDKINYETMRKTSC